MAEDEALLPVIPEGEESSEGEQLHRLYTAEELDALHLPAVPAEEVRHSCQLLARAARFFFDHAEMPPPAASLVMELELVGQSKQLDFYLKHLEAVQESHLRDELTVSLTPESTALTVLTHLWKRCSEFVEHIVAFFLPDRAHPTMAERVVKQSQRVFIKVVLSSRSMQQKVAEDIQETCRSEQVWRIINQLCPTFFKQYLQQVIDHYDDLFGKLIAEPVDPKEFSELVETRLVQEMRMVHRVGFTHGQVKEFETGIYDKMVNYLTIALQSHNSIDRIMQPLDCAAFCRLYSLYAHVPEGTNTLLNMVSGFMLRHVSKIVDLKVDKSAVPTSLIKNLLEFKLSIDLLQSDCCEGDGHFQSQIQAGLQRFFNKIDKFGEFLAIYLDMELRQKRRDELPQLMALVHYVGNKEEFEKVSKLYLARRLIGAVGYDMSLEMEVVESLKADFGNAYIRRIEKMLKDMTLSNEMVAEFSADLGVPVRDGRAVLGQCELAVRVITPGFWPQMAFQRFYSRKHPSRRLNLNVCNGFVVMEARFFGQDAMDQAKTIQKVQENTHYVYPSRTPATVRFMIATPAQAALMDMFNRQLLVEVRKLETEENTELLRTVAGLVRAKVLLKESRGAAEVLLVNELFVSKKSTVNLTKELKLDSKEKRTERVVKSAGHCRSHVDAAIVRILKSKKRLHHSELRAHVEGQLKSKLEETLFKQSLENVVEQSYVRRDPQARDLYHYIE